MTNTRPPNTSGALHAATAAAPAASGRSPAERAAAGRSTALTPAAAVANSTPSAPGGRRRPSRRRRAARAQRRQQQRRLRRLQWGGALVFAMLACLAIGLLLPSQPAFDATDAPDSWAGATGPASTAGALPAPPTVPTDLPTNLPATLPMTGPANRHVELPALTMPAPAPVGRAAADPSAAQGLAGTPPAVAAPYGAAAAGTAQSRGPVVSEADLGIRLAPGSQVDPSAGSRVRAPAGSETVTLVASSSDSADRLTAHYRAQLQATAGGAAVQSYTPALGQVLLQSVNPTTGVSQAVLIAPQAPGAVTVTVVRAQPAPGSTGH